jgi:hypothetical protein
MPTRDRATARLAAENLHSHCENPVASAVVE